MWVELGVLGAWICVYAWSKQRVVKVQYRQQCTKESTHSHVSLYTLPPFKSTRGSCLLEDASVQNYPESLISSFFQFHYRPSITASRKRSNNGELIPP